MKSLQELKKVPTIQKRLLTVMLHLERTSVFDTIDHSTSINTLRDAVISSVGALY